MNQIATITSKRQLTIPSIIFKKAGLTTGQKVIVSLEKGSLRLEPSLLLVNKLAGSVKIPENFKGKSVDQIISQAKKERFSKP